MSDAWRGPVTLWREPRRAAVYRVGGRLVVALAVVALGLIIQYAVVRFVVWAIALLAFAHAGIAVANVIRSKREVLRLAASGVIEWRPSLQEEWLGRPVDFVDGKTIVITAEMKFPIWAPADPRVVLRGETATIRSFPLYGASIDTFVETVNEGLRPRGIAVVHAGSKEAGALRKQRRAGGAASSSGKRGKPAGGDGEQDTTPAEQAD